MMMMIIIMAAAVVARTKVVKLAAIQQVALCFQRPAGRRVAQLVGRPNGPPRRGPLFRLASNHLEDNHPARCEPSSRRTGGRI